MTDGEHRRLSEAVAAIRADGKDALAPLPAVDALAATAPDARRQVLDGLRPDLYALASIIADAAVARARREAPAYPPYGLARSMYSQFRMVVDQPEPFAAGDVGDFRALGQAYLDTMVFHLDRQFKEQLASPEGWMLGQLEQLLARFRVGAGPATRARLKDGFAFMYGGLHFGVSVCSQAAEVMARLLEPWPSLTAENKTEIMVRSVRPAHRLAALNVDTVVPSYQRLLAPSGWMDPGHFLVQQSGDRPWRVELRDEAVPDRGDPASRPASTSGYTTLGCPARVSPSGGTAAITALWRWCVELAHDTGLLRTAPRERLR